MEFRQDVKSVFISVIGCHMTKISLKKQTDHDKKSLPEAKSSGSGSDHCLSYDSRPGRVLLWLPEANLFGGVCTV